MTRGWTSNGVLAGKPPSQTSIFWIFSGIELTKLTKPQVMSILSTTTKGNLKRLRVESFLEGKFQIGKEPLVRSGREAKYREKKTPPDQALVEGLARGLLLPPGCPID